MDLPRRRLGRGSASRHTNPQPMRVMSKVACTAFSRTYVMPKPIYLTFFSSIQPLLPTLPDVLVPQQPRHAPLS